MSFAIVILRSEATKNLVVKNLLQFRVNYATEESRPRQAPEESYRGPFRGLASFRQNMLFLLMLPLNKHGHDDVDVVVYAYGTDNTGARRSGGF